jgi:glycosyltransferase involved in cell wall biosynthesis
MHFHPRPGGIEVLIPVFTVALKQYRFSAFTIRKPRPEEVNIYNGLTMDYCYGSNQNLYAFVRTFIYAFKHRKSVFHVFNIGPVYLILLRLAGVRKLVYGIHGTIYWKTKTQYMIRKSFWALALNSKIRITSNSLFSKKVFKEQINENVSISLLYNPIDLVKFAPLPPGREKSNKQFLIIYCGRLAKGKNLHLWLDTAATIHRTFQDTVFKIYGDGPLKEELIAYAQQLNIISYVQFMGYTSEIAEAYRQADLMIFLSDHESFGNVVVESILCATPVIASNIPSMQEIFQNFPEFLVQTDEKLGENILNKIKDFDKLKAILPQVMNEFRERFSLQQHIEKLDDIYKSFNN